MAEQQDRDTTVLKWAKWYWKQGFSLIPANGKRPMVQWEKYQKERPAYADIEHWWGKQYKGANIALVTGRISNILVVDMDTEEAENFIFGLLNGEGSYPCVKSPHGKHMYFAYREGLVSKAAYKDGLDVKTEGGMIIAPPSTNDGMFYRWLQKEGPAHLEPVPDAIYNTLYSLLTNKVYTSTNCNNNAKTVLSNVVSKVKWLTKGRRDEDLFHLANSLVKGNCHTEFMNIIMKMAALNCNPPFPEKEVQEKIRSAFLRVEKRERNLTDEIREWCLTTSGNFLTTSVYTELHLTTREQKKHAVVILGRLKDEGIIEAYGDRRGSYRLVEKDSKEMEFIEGPVQEFEIGLPLAISNYCVLHPKNIVIVAGGKSSGKTAFLLETVMMNRHKHKIVYFNSEMGSEEWSIRLRNFGVRHSSDVTWKTYERHKDFQDAIDGSETIFIIDFLEIHDNFYEIAKQIRLIHEKLDKGICIIAVQKKGMAELGRGAEFSLEKARLYLTMDYYKERRCTRVRIVDAKHPREPQLHPKGFWCDVKITEGGSRLDIMGDGWNVTGEG